MKSSDSSIGSSPQQLSATMDYEKKLLEIDTAISKLISERQAVLEQAIQDGNQDQSSHHSELAERLALGTQQQLPRHLCEQVFGALLAYEKKYFDTHKKKLKILIPNSEIGRATQAAQKMTATENSLLPYNGSNIAEELSTQEADAIVIASATSATMAETLIELRKHGFLVTNATNISEQYALFSSETTVPTALRQIHGSIAALHACRDFLVQQLPECRLQALERGNDVAALEMIEGALGFILEREIGESMGLQPLVAGIAPVPDSGRSFWLVRRSDNLHRIPADAELGIHIVLTEPFGSQLAQKILLLEEAGIRVQSVDLGTQSTVRDAVLWIHVGRLVNPAGIEKELLSVLGIAATVVAILPGRGQKTVVKAKKLRQKVEVSHQAAKHLPIDSEEQVPPSNAIHSVPPQEAKQHVSRPAPVQHHGNVKV